MGGSGLLVWCIAAVVSAPSGYAICEQAAIVRVQLFFAADSFSRYTGGLRTNQAGPQALILSANYGMRSRRVRFELVKLEER